MRSLIIAALGMLLLISGASATGIGNTVVAISELETEGTCITGANVFQVGDLDSNLLGCGNLLEQNLFIQANDDDLVGLLNFEEGVDEDTGAAEGEDNNTGGEGGEAGEIEEFMGNNFIQSGAMIFNATGTDNDGFQDIDIIANDNCGTIGNFTQMAIQMSDSIGCDNDVFQDTDANVVDSDFTMGTTKQVSLLDNCITGNDNDVDQIADQDILATCLVRSTTTQEALLNQDILGCGNTNDIPDSDDDGQVAVMVIDDSELTTSATAQAVALNEQITGADNAVAQFGNTIIDDSCFTGSLASQSISVRFATLGCDNIADQDAIIENVDNDLVGGRLFQQTTINTNA